MPGAEGNGATAVSSDTLWHDDVVGALHRGWVALAGNVRAVVQRQVVLAYGSPLVGLLPSTVGEHVTPAVALDMDASVAASLRQSRAAGTMRVALPDTPWLTQMARPGQQLLPWSRGPGVWVASALDEKKPAHESRFFCGSG